MPVCIHGRSRCKPCGKGYCIEHNTRNDLCIPCKGGGICEHKKRRTRCVDCKGGSICEHKKIRDSCIECEGSQICEHKKVRSVCKDCCGGSICEHKKIRSICVDCHGGQICIHKKVRSVCKDCEGGSICEHKKVRSDCYICNPSQLCIHEIRKDYCKFCDGSYFCIHEKYKSRCKDCGGSQLCKTPLCETIASKKYEGYCIRCFIYMFPEKEISRNFKTKEKAVVDYVKSEFKDYTWIYNKKVPDGCSKRRPDLFLDLGEQVLIIEIDENQHDSYNCSCESLRIVQLSEDVNGRPLVFIRFNPDEYNDIKNIKNIKIKSCWKTNKKGLLCIDNEEDWNFRLSILKEQIFYWVENRTEKTIEIIQLFYDV